jgi:hypothetical protein
MIRGRDRRGWRCSYMSASEEYWTEPCEVMRGRHASTIQANERRSSTRFAFAALFGGHGKFMGRRGEAFEGATILSKREFRDTILS